MDETDQQLLSLLRKDARTSVATLAQTLGVSRGTVSNRVTKLEDAGIIVGYTVRLKPDAQPTEIGAWMSVAVAGNETRSVIASLLGEPTAVLYSDFEQYEEVGRSAYPVLDQGQVFVTTGGMQISGPGDLAGKAVGALIAWGRHQTGS